jgi:hypothetical protein
MSLSKYENGVAMVKRLRTTALDYKQTGSMYQSEVCPYTAKLGHLMFVVTLSRQGNGKAVPGV